MVPSSTVQFLMLFAACQPASDSPSNSSFQPSAFYASVSVLSAAQAAPQTKANAAHIDSIARALISMSNSPRVV